jgi:hypothetical protein
VCEWCRISIVESCVKGIEAAARPFCLASKVVIILALAPDNLLFKLNRVAATRIFSLTMN